VREKLHKPTDSQVPEYEECLRSFAAEGNGVNPAGERSEALRLVAPLLSEEKEMNSDMVKPTLAQAVNGPQQPIRIPSPPVVAAAQPVRAAGWDDSAKRWP
jgi:hypothetical protein